MVYKTKALLIAAILTTACGNQAGGEGTNLHMGTSSTGGLMAPTQTLSCSPSGLADAGYNLAAELHLDGTASVSLEKISFMGTEPIDMILTASQSIGTGAENELRFYLTHDFLTLTLDISSEEDLYENGNFYGSLTIHGDPFVWGPNHHNVNCNLSVDEPAPENGRALTLEMFGMHPAVDVRAYQTMKQLIATLIAEGKLGKYILIGMGIEGGESSCVELHPYASDSDLEEIEQAFKSIEYNTRTTSYNVARSNSCQ